MRKNTCFECIGSCFLFLDKEWKFFSFLFPLPLSTKHTHTHTFIVSFQWSLIRLFLSVYVCNFTVPFVDIALTFSLDFFFRSFVSFLFFFFFLVFQNAVTIMMIIVMVIITTTSDRIFLSFFSYLLLLLVLNMASCYIDQYVCVCVGKIGSEWMIAFGRYKNIFFLFS